MYHSQICSKTKVFVSIFAAKRVLSARELFAIEKMATASMGNKKIATTLGFAAVDDEAVVAEARDGFAQR